MAAGRLAWVLNLDADLELAAPRGYTPTKGVRDAMAKFVPLLARSLLGPEDLLVDDTTAAGVARGFTGRAFCPTPRALALLARSGAALAPTPPLDVLRRVNSRAFAASLGATLPSAAFVTSLDEASEKLAETPALGGAWRIKRAFGMSGRGQRVVQLGHATEADLAFLRAGMTEGGVQIEPNVVIVDEYAIHGMLADDRSLRVGALLRQRCDARGAWLSSEPLSSPTAAESDLGARLVAEAKLVAGALADAGYFGPFGIDAYTYRAADDATCFQPRSEVNARYSMGFAMGLTAGRDDPGDLTV